MSYTPKNWQTGEIITAEKLNNMAAGIDEAIATAEESAETAAQIATNVEAFVGAPLKASAVSEMTDTDKVYVYVGSESGMTAGHWYYYNGSNWSDGGVYNAVAVQTDDTLSVSGTAADAFATGDGIEVLRDGNAVNLLNRTDQMNRTSAGITWKRLPGFRIQVSGTASSTSIYNFYSNLSPANFPDWLIPGGTYQVKYKSEKVEFRVVASTVQAPSLTSIFSTKSDGMFTLPSDVTSVYIRLAVTSGTSDVNEIVAPRIWDAKTNQELTAELSDAESIITAIQRAEQIDLMPFLGEWVLGTISTTGEDGSSATRIRTIGYADASDLTGIDISLNDGYKCAAVWYSDSALLRDDYWLTGKVMIQKPYGATRLRMVLATSNNSAASLDFVQQLSVLGNYGLLDRITHTTEDMASVTAFPFLPVYTGFKNAQVSPNTYPITLTSFSTLIRRSALLQTQESYQLEMAHPDYLFRLYWYESDHEDLHSTTWGRSWKVPANVDAAITIKRADSGNFSNEERPEQFFRPYDDTPKPYFIEEIEAVAGRVKAANTEPGLCFLLSTDHHTMSVTGTLVKYDTMSDMATNMKALAKKINFDANIALGDLTDYKVGDASHFAAYGVLDNEDYEALDQLFYKWMDDAMDKLASVNPNLLYVPGNHDDNRYINKDVIHATTSEYDYTPGEMFSYYAQRSQLRRVPNLSNNGLDYYVDFPEFKIRMFCLDSNHWYDSTHVSPHGYYNCWWYGYQDSTVEWMQQQLGAVPSDWSVLVCSHLSPVKSNNADDTAYVNLAEMQQVIQSYITGGGNYIATLYGHSHCDWSTTSPWLEICFNSQKCPYVSDDAEYPESSNMPGLHHPKRESGTASEDSWSIVLVQPGSRKIKVIRFGAGLDREFTY